MSAPQSFETQTRNGRTVVVAGKVEGHFGVDKWDRDTLDTGNIFVHGAVYWVTHIPTGGAFGCFLEEATAFEYIEHLQEGLSAVDWSNEDPEYYDRVLLKIYPNTPDIEVVSFNTIEERAEHFERMKEDEDIFPLVPYIGNLVEVFYNHFHKSEDVAKAIDGIDDVDVSGLGL